jgi:segregation and condensation protein A
MLEKGGVTESVAESMAVTDIIPEQQEKYVVHLPAFEGPMDLLLHLIEKRQMEITMISLMAVTDQYLSYLNQREADLLPLADMAAFVAVAARLLYIKSQYLLPSTQKEEGGVVESAVNMVDDLRRHLVEYKAAKEIARILREREEAGLQTHGRSGLLAGIEAQLAWTPPTLVGLEASTLKSAFQRLLEHQARTDANGDDLVPMARVRVSERIAEITSRLEERPTVLLSDVLENEHSRVVIVVTLIAVLEMWKWERVAVFQEDLFGPIVLERGERWHETGQLQLDED